MKIKTVFGGYQVKDGPAVGAPCASSPSAVFDIVKKYRNKDREHFLALYVDARAQVIALEIVSVGTLTASLVHPREVFKGAILNNAAGVILCHNHPSGDPSPSPEDKDCTRRIKNAGELLGIPVLDHVIIGRKRRGAAAGMSHDFYSFKEAGIL